MRAALIAVLALSVTGCATTPTTSKVAGGASLPMCMPCDDPCFPLPDCAAPGVAAAPAPTPAPAPVPTPAAAPTPPAAAGAVHFHPAPGAFGGHQAVTLSSSTPGAAIHYTTDGSDPTSASPAYSGPIEVGKTTTIKAYASAQGMTDGPVASGDYSIEPPKPPPAPARVVVSKGKIELKEKIYFDTGKTTIKPVSHSILDEAATVLQANPELARISIEGHTDNRGDPGRNQRLSEGRAKAVADYLVGKGVAASRLQAKGFGAKRPIADNKTEKGREENRRVEFIVGTP